jgi:hypothetical protein
VQASRLVSGRVCLVLGAILVSCAGAKPADSSVGTARSREETTTETAASASAPGQPRPQAVRPDAAAIYARLTSDFDACYQAGKKSTPTMLDGKLTLNASFDASGKATCAIPTEVTGITQEVEDCMSDRLAAASLGSGEPFTEVVPVVLHGGKLGLGERDGSATLESVETRRMPDAFDVLESLVPQLERCIHSLDRSSAIRSIVVAANVGSSGKAQCVLASPSSGGLPESVSACARAAFESAKFPPPTRGSGVILVPLNLVSR